MKNKSVMKHNFSQVPSVQIPRSQFDRSHGYKTAFDSSFLIPFFVDEALPGDTFKLRHSLFARLATPQHPFMDNLFLDTQYFYVPYRIIQDNWPKLNGEQTNPGDSIDFLTPVTTSGVGGFGANTLFDYMGIPPTIEGINVCSLPMRAYNLIWNEWYRDQNLQNSVSVPKDDGADSATLFLLKKRNKKHDYFTSCLPWPQKGDDVQIGLGATAPVYGNGKSLGLTELQGANQLHGMYDGGSGQGLLTGTNYYNQTLPSAPGTPGQSATTDYALGVVQAPNESGLIADLSTATAVTINALREAFQIQKMLEKDARGGTRYTEVLRTHFGVISPDYRLQRPEYLGGSSTRINVNPVAKTSSTDVESPQANLAAFGTAADSGGGFSKSFTEHGVIIGLVSVRADLTYQQGLNRMWSRRSRYDFYWPSFAHLGEQEVLNKEIFLDGTANDDLVFGYQERYAEYRYKPSNITGAMRSNFAQSLDVWHLSEEFTTRPALNSDFIEDVSNETVDRVIAVQTEPQILLDAYFDLKCARPMPVYSVPGLVDHF